MEFADVLTRLPSEAGNLLLSDDFNFHWESADDTKASQFRNVLDSAGLSQRISEPTYKSGHTLNLVIIRVSEKIVEKTVVSDLSSIKAEKGHTITCKPDSRSYVCVCRDYTIYHVNLAPLVLCIYTNVEKSIHKC